MNFLVLFIIIYNNTKYLLRLKYYITRILFYFDRLYLAVIANGISILILTGKQEEQRNPSLQHGVSYKYIFPFEAAGRSAF